MSNRKRGQSRIAVHRAKPGYSGYVVVDRVAGTTSETFPTLALAERRAKRDRKKLGKKPRIGT